jgi:hypothetical protein
VVQARSSEAVAEVRVETLVLPEDDPGDDRPPLTFDPRRQRARDVASKPVCDTSETAARTDDPEGVGAEHEVNALTTQVCALVELSAFVCGPRLLGRSDELEQCALRRCSPARKLEPSCLVDHAIVPAANANRNADCKRTRASRPGHLNPGESRGADLGHECAAIEICETRPAPPETDEEKRGSEPDGPAPAANGAERREQHGGPSQ